MNYSQSVFSNCRSFTLTLCPLLHISMRFDKIPHPSPLLLHTTSLTPYSLIPHTTSLSLTPPPSPFTRPLFHKLCSPSQGISPPSPLILMHPSSLDPNPSYLTPFPRLSSLPIPKYNICEYCQKAINFTMKITHSKLCKILKFCHAFLNK